MKYVFIYLMFFLWPQQGYSRALCPANMTQEECCAQASMMTLSACNASCSGTCSLGYYDGCYSCEKNCHTGYVLNSRICSFTTSNGSVYQETAHQCNGNSRFDPITNGCVKCPEEYAECDLGSYYLETGEPVLYVNTVTCKDATGIALCTACEGGSGGVVCTRCQQGYTTAHFGTAGTCQPCRYRGCLTCDDDINGCTSCHDGFTLASTVTGGAMCYTTCTDPNCSACNTVDGCSACKSGYTLSDDPARSCIPCPENCATCSSASVCTACADGYKLSGGKCVAQTNTVSSCPPYTTKSSDGCCCIPD